jgi:pSer/pThr/pTyr-binding forkhead associated (FHA) protein
MSELVVTEGPLSGQRFEVAGDLVVGRESADVTLPDAEVSRRHAVLRAAGGGVEIEDLGSTNGTFVNGARIAVATQIVAGDTIEIGKSAFLIEVAAAAASETLVAPGPADTVVAPQATTATPAPTSPTAAAPTPAPRPAGAAPPIPAPPRPAEAAPPAPAPHGAAAARLVPGAWAPRRSPSW